MKRPGLFSVVVLMLASCSESPTRPSGFAGAPEPSQVFAGSATGPTRITFVSADPRPSTTVSGCGTDVRGCPGRVRMVFRLTPSGTGPVLRFVVSLHAASKQACFVAATGPFALRAGEETTFQVVLDPSEPCLTPLAITDLAASVEGPVEVASRQEWTIGYSFAP